MACGDKMQKLKILNKKEIKKIIELIKEQWNADVKLDYAFLMNEKRKIFVVSKDITRVELSKLRINSIGMYFGLLNNNVPRLSIEGSQIIGPRAKKNVLELNEKEVREWLRGADSIKDAKQGFLIIKHKNDFLGTGKSIGNKVLNFVSKERRIITTC